MAKELKFRELHKVGDEVAYHGREGKIEEFVDGGVVVYFSDIDESVWLDEDELLEQGNDW